MRFDVGLPDFAAIEKEELDKLDRELIADVSEATDYLKEVLREQTMAAGMGSRMAKTWRSEIYQGGRNYLSPAGFIWSKAPEIVQSFSDGATIRPANGAKYLWVPSKNVPYALGKRRRKMTPDEVDSLYNAEFVIVGSKKPGVLLAFIEVVNSRNGRTFRQATAGRLKGRKGSPARKAKLVHMFTLVKSVKMPKLFDLEAAALEAESYLQSLLEG